MYRRPTRVYIQKDKTDESEEVQKSHYVLHKEASRKTERFFESIWVKFVPRVLLLRVSVVRWHHWGPMILTSAGLIGSLRNPEGGNLAKWNRSPPDGNVHYWGRTVRLRSQKMKKKRNRSPGATVWQPGAAPPDDNVHYWGRNVPLRTQRKKKEGNSPTHFKWSQWGLLGAWITGNSHTTLHFDKPVEWHWWT
jgi:hypothetical protein